MDTEPKPLRHQRTEPATRHARDRPAQLLDQADAFKI
jgi:hypothetical protein